MYYVDACISIDRCNYENPQKRHHGHFVNLYAASVPPSNSIIHLSISKLEVEFQINILMLLCMIRLDLANCSKLMEMTTCIYLVNHHSWFIIRRFQKLSCATCCVFRFTFMHIYNHIYTQTYMYQGLSSVLDLSRIFARFTISTQIYIYSYLSIQIDIYTYLQLYLY